MDEMRQERGPLQENQEENRQENRQEKAGRNSQTDIPAPPARGGGGNGTGEEKKRIRAGNGARVER